MASGQLPSTACLSSVKPTHMIVGTFSRIPRCKSSSRIQECGHGSCDTVIAGTNTPRVLPYQTLDYTTPDQGPETSEGLFSLWTQPGNSVSNRPQDTGLHYGMAEFGHSGSRARICQDQNDRFHGVLLDIHTFRTVSIVNPGEVEKKPLGEISIV